ncbi:NUDIX hydrolase [Cellulomonas hominis]
MTAGTGSDVAGARAELAALCARGPVWTPDPLSDFGSPASVRRSAVLVLFGVLDSVPAATAHPAVARDLDVLLTRRSALIGHHPGQVSFPGGGIDPGDADERAAALREAVEETGLDPAGVEILGTLPPLPVVVSNNLVTPVPAWWTSPSPVAATDPAETVDVFRVPVADLVDPARRCTTVLTRGGRTYRGPAFEAGGVLVWGFTAFVLDRMLDALGWAVPWDEGRTVPAPV